MKFIILILFTCTLIFAQQSQTSFVELQYYTGGKNAISIEQVSENTDFKTVLKGTTKFQKLLVTYKKNGNSEERRSYLKTDKDGNFNHEILFQDGKGKYTFTIFGTNENSNSYAGLLFFNLNSTTDIPEDFDFVFVSYYSMKGKLKIDQLKKKIGYKLPINIETDYYALWYSIKKKGTNGGVDLNFQPIENTKLKKNFILREGKGIYEVNINGMKSPGMSEYEVLATYQVESTEDTPENIFNLNLNDKIISYIEDKKGKKIGRGECWDVVQEVLDENSASWKTPTEFGKILDPKKDTILPGDIIQFTSVTLIDGNVTNYFGAPDHTAVVYKVNGILNYSLAHQNVNGSRYIIVTEVDLNKMVSGTIKFYRPLVGLIND